MYDNDWVQDGYGQRAQVKVKEHAELRADIKALRSELDAALAERDALKIENARLAEMWKAEATHYQECSADLTAERAHADRLAEAVRRLLSPQECDGSGDTIVQHFSGDGEYEGQEHVLCAGCGACAQSAVETALTAHDARRQPATEGESDARY